MDKGKKICPQASNTGRSWPQAAGVSMTVDVSLNDPKNKASAKEETRLKGKDNKIETACAENGDSIGATSNEANGTSTNTVTNDEADAGVENGNSTGAIPSEVNGTSVNTVTNSEANAAVFINADEAFLAEIEKARKRLVFDPFPGLLAPEQVVRSDILPILPASKIDFRLKLHRLLHGSEPITAKTRDDCEAKCERIVKMLRKDATWAPFIPRNFSPPSAYNGSPIIQNPIGPVAGSMINFGGWYPSYPSNFNPYVAYPQTGPQYYPQSGAYPCTAAWPQARGPPMHVHQPVPHYAAPGGYMQSYPQQYLHQPFGQSLSEFPSLPSPQVRTVDHAASIVTASQSLDVKAAPFIPSKTYAKVVAASIPSTTATVSVPSTAAAPTVNGDAEVETTSVPSPTPAPAVANGDAKVKTKRVLSSTPAPAVNGLGDAEAEAKNANES